MTNLDFSVIRKEGISKEHASDKNTTFPKTGANVKEDVKEESASWDIAQEMMGQVKSRGSLPTPPPASTPFMSGTDGVPDGAVNHQDLTRTVRPARKSRKLTL